MCKKHHFFMLFGLGLLLSMNIAAVAAQEDTQRQIITLSNSAQLTEINVIDLDSSSVGFLVFSPNGTALAVGTDTGLRLYDAVTGDANDYLTRENVNTPFFSPDGRQLATNTFSCSSPGVCRSNIYLVNAETGEEQLSIRADGVVLATILSPDGALLAYASNDTKRVQGDVLIGTSMGPSILHVLQLDSGEERLALNQDWAITALFFSPDGTQLGYTATDWTDTAPKPETATLHIIDLETGQETTVLKTGGATWISPDWTTAFARSEGIGHMTKIETGEHTYLPDFDKIAFSPDSTIAAVEGGELEPSVAILNAGTGDEIARLVNEDADFVYDVAFNHDGTLIAAAYHTSSDEVYIRVWGII